ncbi:YlbF family regulator [Streptococcus equinus]|uniref:YlbF family regulator n=1 Tax=Streptococcus equinus TaxID=1335 RepID=UPI00215B64C4|nr:YlbF family regulator [Streptococcus equinus]UVF02384.1 YlbF family regulator [Streptococcus equinus]
MLAIDEQLFEIDEAIDEVAKAFLTLDAVQAYLEIKKIFLADTALQESISEFQDLKQSYEEVKDYAAFRPEVKEIRRQLLQKKRELDLNSTVSALRQSEVAVQAILADLTQEISSVISPMIFVDTGLPLATPKSHHQHCSKGGKRDV